MIIPRIPALLLVLTCISHAAPADAGSLPSVILGTSPATTPAARYDSHIQANLDKLKNGPYDLIFDGDSITDFWQQAGADVWKARYGSLKAVDFGVSGDGVQNVLWRVQHGELAGQDPKLIILLIGINNGGENPKEVADGIKLLLNEYETRCPNAHILLLGIFPNGAAPTHPLRPWAANVNKLISAFDDGKRVTYLDIGAKFLQPDGTITPEIMPDFTHPSAKGYKIWADAIQSIIDQYFPPAPAK